MNKINVILLHGIWPEKIDGKLIADIPLCNPNNEGNWMGWTKKRLEAQGYQATCPVISDAWNAPYEQWKTELDKTRIDENTILVGWSAGAGVFLRYLGETGKKIKRLILIAPGFLPAKTPSQDFPNSKNFYPSQISPNLKDQIKDRVVVFASNDPYEGVLRSIASCSELFNAKIIQFENFGHFSFLIKELPELLEEIVK